MLTLITDLDLFTKKRKTLNKDEIGFVATMGNLHQGHLSLIQASLNKNKITIISIFVNPKQFGPNEDFEKYPRTLNDDIEQIKKINSSKEIIVFAPEIKDIYPKDFSAKICIIGPLRNILCDLDRPTHFDGVTTVVYLLFKIIDPKHAYFGEKDYQQLQLIKKMNKDLILEVIINSCPTIRQENGLAISSRNQYLGKTDILNALKLFNSLQSLKKSYLEQGILKTTELRNKTIQADSLFSYLEILDATNLQKVTNSTSSIIIAGVYNLQKTRLIDNIIFDVSK